MTRLRQFWLWLLRAVLIAACESAPAQTVFTAAPQSPTAVSAATPAAAALTVAIRHSDDIHGYIEPQKVALPDGNQYDLEGALFEEQTLFVTTVSPEEF
jgi:hypothetical protein